MSHGTFSTLQHLLKQAYSADISVQQQAAIDLSNLIEQAGAFPAVSFAPLAHALSKLLPSNDRTISTYSAKALKSLLLDDALRPQAISAGVPAIVVEAIVRWEDEVLVLRELLGVLQTLCWDSRCLRGVLQNDIISSLSDFSQSSDIEVSILAITTIANILSFADTLLLADTVNIESLGATLPILMDILRKSSNRSQRFYSIAAIANACAHPRLQNLLKEHHCLELVREIERQSLMNLHELGSKMSDCAHTAVSLLSDKNEKIEGEKINKYRY